MPVYLATGTPVIDPGLYPLPAGIQLLWHGWDGSTWDLGHGSQGVVLRAGARLFDKPDYDWYDTDAAGVDGSADRGSRALPRAGFMPIGIMDVRGGQDFLDLDSRFMRTMRRGKYGTLECIQPGRGVGDAESRSLTLRFEGMQNNALDTDPALLGRADYGISTYSPQPMWYGDEIVTDWTAGTAINWLGGGSAHVHYGPPIRISKGSSISAATVTNPGDGEAWPVWEAFGPFTSVTVGLDGRLVTLPVTVADGKAVIFDSSAQTAVDANVTYATDGSKVAVPVYPTNRLTSQLTSVDWAPIPAEQSVSLALAMTSTGGGIIRARFRPPYERAW